MKTSEVTVPLDIWHDGKEARFKFDGIEFAARKGSRGVILFAPQVPDRHWTLVADDYHLTIHETLETTFCFPGIDIRHKEHGVPPVSFQFERLERLLSAERFLKAARERFLRGYKQLRTPQHLRAEGACTLTSVPVSIDGDGNFVADEPESSEIVTGKPISEPWEAPEGSVWLAGTARGRTLGLIFVSQGSCNKRVHLLRARETLEAWQWFMRAISSPRSPTRLD